MQNILGLLEDPKGWLKDQVKSFVGDVGERAYHEGMALAINKEFCDVHLQDPDCLQISKVAEGVADNSDPSFGGTFDRVKGVWAGVTGFWGNKFTDLQKELDTFKIDGH